MYRSILWLVCLFPSALCAQVSFDGALGITFDMNESQLNSLGFTKLWSPESLKRVGVYSRMGHSEYFNMIRVGASPKDGAIYWVEGGKFFADSDLETCNAHFRTIEDTVRKKYPKLVALRRPGGKLSHSVSYCEATKPGFIPGLTPLCEGRYVSLLCVADEEGGPSLLLVRYSKSTDETKRLDDDINAYRNEHQTEAMKKEGFEENMF